MTETRLRKMMRGVSCVVTLCGVCAMLVFVTGCPVITPVPECTADDLSACTEAGACEEASCSDAGQCVYTTTCTETQTCVEDVCVEVCQEDADCDDADLCTTDTCVDGACSNVALDCDDDDMCTTDECVDGECVNTDVVCDDGEFCNGTETCDAETGECVDGTAPCDADTQTCDEEADVCEDNCEFDDECDDEDMCTTDACVDGVCVNTAMECDDEDLCTTDECVDGECVYTDVECEEGFSCDDTTGECVEDAACETDEDCEDDGLFCNGVPSCVDGVCTAGDDPCADEGCECDGEAVDAECTEGDDAAVCTCPDCESVDFTLNQDDLSGSTSDDIFNAPLIYAEGAGAQRDSLQTGDVAAGLAGDDQLFATLTQGNNPVVTLTGIEEIYVTNYAAETINAASISGVELFGWLNATTNLTVNTIGNLVDASIDGIATAGTTFSLSFQAGTTTSPTTASDDEITLTVADTTTGTFNVTTAANGFETLNVDCVGDIASTLTAITQTTGTSMAKAVFTGAQDLTVNAIPATILTIDASSMSGALTLGAGTEDSTYAEFANPTSNWLQITGGAGDDVLIFEDTLATTDFASGTIDLGDGTDVVQATYSGSFSGACKLRNVEEVRFNATADMSYNFSGITGLTTITIEEDGSAQTITTSNIPVTSTSNTWPTLNFRGDDTTGADLTFDDVTFGATGATGSSDTLNINVGNRGKNLNSGSLTSSEFNIGDTELTAAGFETINIDVADGPATFNGITASTLITLDVDAATSNTGTNVTLGTVQTGSGTTLLTVDASGVTGKFNATLDYMADGGSITTGDGDDTVVVGSNSAATHSLTVNLGNGNNTYTGDQTTAGVDLVTCGTGNDTVTPGQGADTVDLGTGGTDIFNCDTSDEDQGGSPDIDTVTNFVPGTGGDKIQLDLSSIEAIEDSGGTDCDLIGSEATSATTGSTMVLYNCTADACDPGSEAFIVLIDDQLATFANDAALLAGIATVTITVTNNMADSDALLVGYSDGSGNTRIAMIINDSGGAIGNTDTAAKVEDILVLTGVDEDDLVAANFEFK